MRAECWRLSVSEPCRSSQGGSELRQRGLVCVPSSRLPRRRPRARRRSFSARPSSPACGGHKVPGLHDVAASSAAKERGAVSGWDGLVGMRGSSRVDKMNAARARAAC